MITFKKDFKSRSKISIKVRDDLDIIFNEFIQNVLPSSFLKILTFTLMPTKKSI